MPSVYEQTGLRFEYPENWILDEADDSAVSQVVVSSPHTAFWHLTKHAADTELEPLFDEALAALRSEFKEMETEPAESTMMEGFAISGFDVNFICLDLTITSWLRGFQTDDSTYLLLCQAEDREFAQVGIVFQAMLASLLRNLE